MVDDPAFKSPYAISPELVGSISHIIWTASVADTAHPSVDSAGKMSTLWSAPCFSLSNIAKTRCMSFRQSDCNNCPFNSPNFRHRQRPGSQIPFSPDLRTIFVSAGDFLEDILAFLLSSFSPSRQYGSSSYGHRSSAYGTSKSCVFSVPSSFSP